MLKTKLKNNDQSKLWIVNKLTLNQIVKIVESIDLKLLPMNEKSHELLKKLFNKSNSLKDKHEKISIAKEKAYREYDYENEQTRSFSYYPSKLIWRK